MGDDHLKPLRILTPQQLQKEIMSPESRRDDESGWPYVFIGRVEVRKPVKLDVMLLHGVPLKMEDCLCTDLTLMGTCETASDAEPAPRVELIRQRGKALMTVGRFETVCVTEANVGTARFDGEIGTLLLDGRAAYTLISGAIDNLTFGGWTTCELMTNGADPRTRCWATTKCDGKPLIVSGCIHTDVRVWAEAMHYLCPNAPVVFNGRMSELYRG